MARLNRTGRKARLNDRDEVLTLRQLATRRATAFIEKIWPGNSGSERRLEALENRTLLSGSVSLNGNTLVFVGNSDSSNSMSATISGSTITASVDGASQSFNAAGVVNIQAYLGNDGDTLAIASGIDASTIVQGGNGNDYISVGGGNATVYGNAGNDTIIGNGGNNEFHGNGGNDSIIGGSGSSTLYGDDGNDTIVGQGSSDIIGGGTGSNITQGTANDTIVNNTNIQEAPKPLAVEPLQAVIHFKSDNNEYAGMTVFVNGLASGLGVGTLMTADYEWNFGDPNGEYNSLSGFTAGHQYNTPGSYTITLTVTNQDGQSASTTAQVNVQSTNSLRSIYVAPWGNDGNDGSTVNDPVQSVDRASELLGTNTRLLFAAGGVYDVDQNININGYKNVVIGSYGSGAQPVLMYDGYSQGYDQIINFQVGSTNITINNLTFDSIYTNNNGEPDAMNLNGFNITVSDCTFLHLTDALDMALGPVGVMALDNSAPNPSDMLAYFAYVNGVNTVLLGNYVANSVNEHVVRVDGGRQLLIADNTFSNVGGVKDALNIQYGFYANVEDNTLTGTDQIGPLATTQIGSLANFTAQFDYAVFQGNYISGGSFIVEPGAYDVNITSNVFNGTNDQAIIIAPYDELYGRIASNIDILGNTVFDNGQQGNFLSLDGQASQIVVEDNLYSAELVIGYNHSVPVWVSDPDMSSFSAITNNIWSASQSNSGDVMYLGDTWWSPTSYITAAQWDSLAPVSNDMFATVNVNSSTFAIDGPSIAQTYGIAIPGLFDDFNGNFLPANGISVGAVQVGGVNAPPQLSITTGNAPSALAGDDSKSK